MVQETLYLEMDASDICFNTRMLLERDSKNYACIETPDNAILRFIAFASQSIQMLKGNALT